MRVLVIEDDHLLARAVARVLAPYGYAVTIVHDCASARAAEPVDAAIVDIDLPDGNGVDLADELLQAGRIHVSVFFSATTDTKTIERAKARGAFVHKAGGIGPLPDTLAASLSDAVQALAAGGEGLITPGGTRVGSGAIPKVPR